MFNKDFLKDLPANIFSGFVVSLIALPLGFGLALASGAPPISGVIAAVVGGIVVSIIGGSNVTITGPGNGLVVVVLGAITTLGAGDMYQGYLFALAAIILSGAIIALLAFFNLGRLSDFFPSSAIQGMLAAIGLIILSKQAHIMLGSLDASGSTVELILGIPRAILNVFENPDLRPAALAGVLSLGIMAFYPRIRNKYVQLIPAPMWIVMLSVGLAYYFENSQGGSHPISSEYFISIPDDLLTKFPTPDFSKIGDFNFITAVFSITLIASIESLLSIKAVDKLDPLRRRSNVNKDLKALGLATVISGFLGGLNVVTVIARSSVNVNSNGTNRSANLFHALFLIVFVLLLKEQLQHIPYPALAAMLVYTGYKLASPTIVRKVLEIGREQVFIFFVTLLTTLFFGIIVGIIVGILVTFITHIILTKSITLFYDYLTHNNINTYNEEDGTLHVTVKHFCSFANFYRLKNILDNIEPNKKVIVDFLDASFIDHTVLENMWDYEQYFDKNGGDFEVIGMDLHTTGTEHPFALRRALEMAYIIGKATDNLTTRQKSIKRFVEGLSWEFKPASDYHMFFLRNFKYFKTRRVDHLYNFGIDPKNRIKLFDIEYSEGAFILEEELHASMIYIKTNRKIPVFTLDKGTLYERLHTLGSFKEVKLKSFRDFANRFTLRGNSLRELRRFFDDSMVLFIECNCSYHIESDGRGGVLILDKERHASVGEIKAMVDFSVRFEEKLNSISKNEF